MCVNSSFWRIYDLFDTSLRATGKLSRQARNFLILVSYQEEEIGEKTLLNLKIGNEKEVHMTPPTSSLEILLSITLFYDLGNINWQNDYSHHIVVTFILDCSRSWILRASSKKQCNMFCNFVHTFKLHVNCPNRMQQCQYWIRLYITKQKIIPVMPASPGNGLFKKTNSYLCNCQVFVNWQMLPW